MKHEEEGSTFTVSGVLVSKKATTFLRWKKVVYWNLRKNVNHIIIFIM